MALPPVQVPFGQEKALVFDVSNPSDETVQATLSSSDPSVLLPESKVTLQPQSSATVNAAVMPGQVGHFESSLTAESRSLGKRFYHVVGEALPPQPTTVEILAALGQDETSVVQVLNPRSVPMEYETKLQTDAPEGVFKLLSKKR